MNSSTPKDAEIKEPYGVAINKKDEQIDKLITVSEELVNKTYQLESKLVKEKAQAVGSRFLCRDEP